MSSIDKQSSLLHKNVLQIRLKESYSEHYIFFVSYKWAQ
jgi:hypothetical protein